MIVWTAAPRWTLIWGGLLVMQGLLPVAAVSMTRRLVDSLVATLNAGGTWQSVQPALVLAALMAAIMLLTELVRSATRWVLTVHTECVQDHVNALIHRQSMAVDLAFYESPEYYDQLHRACSEAAYRPASLLESSGNLFHNSLALVALSVVLIPYGAWIPVSLLLSALPALYVTVRANLRQHQWRQRTTADERRTWYYDWLLTSDEAAAEMRFFELGSYFQSAYQTVRRQLRRERLQLAKEQGLAEMGAGATTLLLTGVVLAWVAWHTVQGLLTLGELALFYQAFHQGQRFLRTLLGHVGHLYTNSLFLGNLFAFLDLKPRLLSPQHSLPVSGDVQQGVRFSQVTFRYPGSQHAALENFSLTIPAGQIVAIVGPNGSGKSTLVKLLCRLYDPDAGQITLDDVDLRCMRLEELRQLITVVFQTPVHYNASAADNIALGDVAAAPSRAAIAHAARVAGADTPIADLPQGYDSLLGKWFTGGAELSVGEWQRLALARAFLRPAPLIVLDEPTSAMDPWAEADWLRNFREFAATRTALIITHRFTTAMHADYIHVMHHSGIVESGSHEELLALDGHYAAAWAAQVFSHTSSPSL